MSTLEEGLYAFLTANAGVFGLVGERIYPQVIPQDAPMPAVAYQRISSPREYSHYPGASGLARARMQFTCEGDSYRQAKRVAEAIRAALSGYKGVAGDVTIGAAFLENENDSYSEGYQMPVVRVDYVIWYQE